MPVYAMEDANKRLRMIKYTPEYMHCQAAFYGPAVPPNTGLLAIQKLANNTPNSGLLLLVLCWNRMNISEL